MFSNTVQSNKTKIIERGKELLIDMLGRQDLNSKPRQGPVLIHDVNSTVYTPPEWSALKDPEDNIILTRVY
jgi:hypothetical protein